MTEGRQFDTLNSSMPFPFEGDEFPAELGAVVQRTVVSGELPALLVIHDDENEWVVHDGVTDPMEDGACIIWHMGHVAEADPSVAKTADLPIGQVAWRRSPDEEWVYEPWKYADE